MNPYMVHNIHKVAFTRAPQFCEWPLWNTNLLAAMNRCTFILDLRRTLDVISLIFSKVAGMGGRMSSVIRLKLISIKSLMMDWLFSKLNNQLFEIRVGYLFIQITEYLNEVSLNHLPGSSLFIHKDGLTHKVSSEIILPLIIVSLERILNKCSNSTSHEVHTWFQSWSDKNELALGF